MVRGLVVAAVLLLQVAALNVNAQEANTEFHLFRDVDVGEYVITLDESAPYDTGFWGSGNTAVYANNGREWAMRLVDYGDTLVMNAGTVDVDLRFGGGGDQVGRGNLNWELTYKGTQLAAVTGTAFQFTAGAATYSSNADIAAGTYDLTSGDFVFRVWTSGHIGNGARLDMVQTNLFMPIAVPAAAPPEEIEPTTLTLEDASLRHEFAEPHDDIYVVTFPVAFQNGSARFNATVAAGTVAYDMTDADGETIASGTLDADDGFDAAFTAAATGQWTLVLEYAGFQGSFGFDVLERLDEDGTLAPPSGSGGSGGSGGGGAGGNGTESPQGNGTTGGSTKESPGLPLLVAGGVLVALALRRRD